jgi:hypothetical protein
MNTSSHYALTYYVNYTMNFIEFNFSIPKHIYGSNILMFTEHLADSHFSMVACSDLKYAMNKSFKFLDAFIRKFMIMQFPDTNNYDLKDLEVNRIDVCFNQVFKSKEEALLYLDYQKKLKKKYARNEDGVMREYSTSLMYVTKRYSAKIYHKGTEYEKNDLKEHLKINAQKKFEYFKTKDFQKFGDRILRYELTIRNTFLNYLHKCYLFRKKDKTFQTALMKYALVDSVIQKNDRIAKKIGTLSGEAKILYMLEHPYEKIKKEDRLVYKLVQKIINKRTYFMIETDMASVLYNEKHVPYDCETAKFSKELLDLCFEKLVSFMEEFQIKELPAEELIKRQIELHNSINKIKLPKSEMISFYSQLVKYGSFKEMEKYAGYSRATMYRYKERFKKIGVTETSVIRFTGDEIPKAFLDLRDYHYELIYHYHHIPRRIRCEY